MGHKDINKLLMLIGVFVLFIMSGTSFGEHQTGYIIKRDIILSPSPPGNTVKDTIHVYCYDISTLRLLDCAFTRKIIGLKSPKEDLDNNGGHTHNYDTHPLVEPPQPDGALEVNVVDGDPDKLGVSGQTQNSDVTITHPIPQVAGKIRIEATLVAPWGWYCVWKCYTPYSWRYEETIDVKINELHRLEDSGDYHVVCRSEWCPPNLPPEGVSHPEGTYGTSETIETLKEIAKEYFELTDGRKLSVNDISLPKGGLFDWRATWAPPHIEHRTGTDTDINRQGVDCYYDQKLKDAVKAVADGQKKPYLQCENAQGRPVPQDDPTGIFKHIDFE